MYSIIKTISSVGVWLVLVASVATAAERKQYARDVQPLLQKYCLDCHYDGDDAEGGVNLERFESEAHVLGDREVWRNVFDKVEARQMPPPKESELPTDEERRVILAWIADIAAQPDPHLGVRDPGKPILRRLTRLEYNNTVRDLLGLDVDLFMFSERLPLANKQYFQPDTGKLESPLTVRVREYGGKYPVLLPASGLPSDNRAEHGYRNRGDAMNVSPLLLEKFVALAGEIVEHPDLPQRSPRFAELLGLDPLDRPSASNARPAADIVPAIAKFASDLSQINEANNNALGLDALRHELLAAHAAGRGGVFDVPEALKGQTIAGKGGLIKVSFGDDKRLTINPDIDLWLVTFSSAEAASRPMLIANKVKNQKSYELTFSIRDGEEGEGITTLGLCVLGRRNQSGEVNLSATFTNGSTKASSATIEEGPSGTTYFSFAAPEGETIRRLKIDGSQFSGEFLLIDDIAFVTNGRPQRPSVDQTADKVGKTAEKPSPSKQNRSGTDAEPKKVASPAGPRERLAVFLSRAFRRPVTDDEVSLYLGLFESARQSGRSEADAMRLAAQAVLSSPSFLFLAESSHDRPMASPSSSATHSPMVRPLTDHELANRLSYFLWSSMPDEELMQLANKGALRDDATLTAQVRRMLRDPKSRELSESFAVQWLRLDQLYTSQPERRIFKQFYSGPQGKNTLHSSQLVEALLLFETVQIENRSILDFIAADYTWVNPRLAQLYGLDINQPVEPQEDSAAVGNLELPVSDRGSDNLWRRLNLADSSRGGYLTMSAPLTVTSLPFRTSPVKRGAWMLETVFNRPPTEPKVAFAFEDDTQASAAAESIRSRFEAHRSQAACYSCHIRIDPPGFALERFDAIGGWRELDGGQPVDAQGEWNGRGFDGPAEFKAVLRQDPHEFTRGFIEHLLSYALGRKLELADLPAVEEIQEKAGESDYRLQQIVEEIVASYPFRNVRNDRGLPQ